MKLPDFSLIVDKHSFFTGCLLSHIVSWNSGSVEWDWQKEDYCVQKDPNYEISQCLWNGTTQKEDLSYMMDDETTPIKACGDLPYHVGHGDHLSKEAEECRESSSSLLKRRRVLQFNTQAVDSCEEISSTFLKSNEMDDSFQTTLPSMSNWAPEFPGNISASGFEILDHSSDGWIAECFNDVEMQCNPNDLLCSPEDLNLSGASDLQANVREFNGTAPEKENNVAQQQINQTPRKIVFKGSKSYIRAPIKMASSVVYPFAFIKPSGARGDVTLKDINQRIQTPPPSKSNQTAGDSRASYPTSAFSGKPVVGKTKIRTDGGNGSITIMRTKDN